MTRRRRGAAALPFLSLILSIELTTCIFDFAVTAAGRYPRLAPTQSSAFMKILEWATPSAVYSWFGTFIWLAYPIFMLARVLDLDAQVHGAPYALLATLYRPLWQLMAVPTALYLWHEAAQGWFIVQSWREQLRKSARADADAAETPTPTPAPTRGTGLDAKLLQAMLRDDIAQARSAALAAKATRCVVVESRARVNVGALTSRARCRLSRSAAGVPWDRPAELAYSDSFFDCDKYQLSPDEQLVSDARLLSLSFFLFLSLSLLRLYS